MSSIFDFSKLGELIKNNPLSAVIIVDTNVVMDNPDFLQWHSDLVDPIFVLTHLTIAELAFHSQTKGDKPPKDQVIKAKKANDAFLLLTEQGDHSIGVHLDQVGWFITIPLPDEDKLGPELAKMGIIRNALHDTDTSLMILHREICREFPGTSVLSLTGDKFYTSFGRYIGLLVYNSQSFPLTIIDWLNRKLPKPVVDFDKELSAAITRLKKDLIKVRLTLISRRFDRNYNLGYESRTCFGALIAEGEGLLSHPLMGDFGFMWQLLYRPGTSVVLASHPLLGEGDMYDDESPSNSDISPTVILNFLGRDNDVPQSLQRLIEHKLGIMANPLFGSDDLPSLQSSLCITQYFIQMLRAADIMNEASKDKSKSTEEYVKNFLDSWQDPYVFTDYADFYTYMVERLSKFPAADVVGLMVKFMKVWNVGHSIELVLPPEEISSDNSG